MAIDAQNQTLFWGDHSFTIEKDAAAAAAAAAAASYCICGIPVYIPPRLSPYSYVLISSPGSRALHQYNSG